MDQSDEPSSPVELRGAFKSIPTRTSGIHFCELWPKLAARSDKFALLRAIDSDANDHTPGMENLAMLGKGTLMDAAGEPATRNGISYVLLNPNSRYSGLVHFQVNNPFAPVWDPQSKSFKQPGASEDAALTAKRLAERKPLLDAFDTNPPHSPQIEKMTKFYNTAFELLQGGGDLYKALKLAPADRARFGNSFIGDMALTATQFIREGAGAVTIFDDQRGPDPRSQSWDLHEKIEPNMKRKAPETDHVAAMLIDEITSGSLNAMLLIMGEIPREPRLNNLNGGREHWQFGNQAILVGGKIKPGVVHGKSSKYPTMHDSEGVVHQKGELGNTILVACGAELSPALPRAREILM